LSIFHSHTSDFHFPFHKSKHIRLINIELASRTAKFWPRIEVWIMLPAFIP